MPISPTPRALIGALALCGLMAGVVIGTRSIDEPDRRSECTRLSTGVWSCTFMTSGRTARVMVRAFEDGSARAITLDPDARR